MAIPSDGRTPRCLIDTWPRLDPAPNSEKMASVGGVLNLQFVDETGNVEAEEGFSRGRKRRAWEAGYEIDDDSDSDGVVAEKPRPGKKTRGRVKIRMAYISDKVRRYTTFSKRKTGIMKKVLTADVKNVKFVGKN